MAAAYIPTDEARRFVEEMASFGMPRRRIAAVLGIGEETLRSHFQDELNEGVAVAAVEVRRSLWQLATGWIDPESGKRHKPDAYSGRVWLEVQGLSQAKLAEAKTEKVLPNAGAVDLRSLSLDELRTLERILGPKQGIVIDVSPAERGGDPRGGGAAGGVVPALAPARAAENDVQAAAPSGARRRTRKG